MQKDVIYIDVEDDITAIIGKVKDAEKKVVALVPPKRIGVLQSAVNLRLIERAARQKQKNLVLITSNSALGSLAASAKIPVAKNLQSRPELGEIAALNVDDGEDVIDGAQLPVGEHAKQSETTSPSSSTFDAAAADVISDNDTPGLDNEVPKAVAPSVGETPAKPRVKKGSKVPNFNTFRKRLLLIGGGFIILVIFLVWAIFFAGRATVYITAKTSSTSVNDTVTLSPSASTNSDKKVLRSTNQELSKNVSIDFPATGEKNVGDKATGSITIHTCVASTSPPPDVPSGTTVSSGGNNYSTGETASFTQGTFGNGCLNYKTNAVSITAAEGGADYNVSGDSFAVSGHSNMTGSGSASGGTDKTVKVVTKSDVAKAKQQLDDQSTDSIKSDLEKQFGKDVTVIGDSFTSDTSGVSASPAAGQEASNGKGTFSGSVKYAMIGVTNSELKDYLQTYFTSQLDNQKNQRVYDSGVSTAQFANVDVGKTSSAQLTASGKVGPKIDDAKVKQLTEGKRYHEIQEALQSIQGVSNVDTKYWPFWVSHAPHDPNRITVKFKLNDSK